MTAFREVRAELLRPGQLKARREKADVAFLPLGALEFHGLPNPIGVDYLSSHFASCRAAEILGGGVAFPPLLWGLPRDSFFVDQVDRVTDKAAAAYGTDADVVRGAHPHGGLDMQTQWQNYQSIIRMALEQIAGFGFRSIYVVAGHAPLTHFAHSVCVAFSRARAMAGHPVTTDFGGAWDAAELGVDHGGKYETSAMMGIDETMVDLTELDRHPEYNGIGCGSNVGESSAESGKQWLEDCAKALAEEARWMVDNYPDLPPRHGHRRTPR